jgi:proline iminopeptidase
VSDAAHWTWDQWADDIAALGETLGIHHPYLLGTSSGAVVAMACAARHPSVVAGLVLDSPLGVPTTLEETLEVFERRGGAPAREAAARYLQGDTSDEAGREWREHGLPLYSNGPPGDMEQRIARARINNAVQTHFRQGGCGPVDIYEPSVPVLILVGRDDPVVPAAAAMRLAERLHAAIRVVECGHGVLRQAPDTAAAAIAGFLAEIRAGRPPTAGARAADPARTDGAAGDPA